MLYSFLLFLWWLSYHRLFSFLHLTQTLPYTTCDILWALAVDSVVDKHCVSTKPIINRPESLWRIFFQSIVFVFIQCGHKEWVWVVQIRNYRQQISKYGINRKISRACLVTCAGRCSNEYVGLYCDGGVCVCWHFHTCECSTNVYELCVIIFCTENWTVIFLLHTCLQYYCCTPNKKGRTDPWNRLRRRRREGKYSASAVNMYLKER